MAAKRRQDMLAVLRRAFKESERKLNEFASTTRTPVQSVYNVFRDGENRVTLRTAQVWADELDLRLVAAKEEIARHDATIRAMKGKVSIESGKSRRGRRL